MTRTASWWTIPCLVLVLFAVACGGGEGEGDEGRVEEVAALREQKAQLDAARERIAELEAELEALRGMEIEPGEEAPAEGEAPVEGEGAEPAATPEELEARIEEAEKEAMSLGEEFNGELVAFINADPPIAGEPLDEAQLAAMELKIQEDMIVAREYISEGGDYDRAIDIMTNLLPIIPEEQRDQVPVVAELEAELAEAREMRYMSEERFATVEKGMTRDEVREAIGQVKYNLVQEYPEDDVILWLYRKKPQDEGGSGGAAGVYFQRKPDEVEYRVYRADFDAVKPEGEEEG